MSSSLGPNNMKDADCEKRHATQQAPIPFMPVKLILPRRLQESGQTLPRKNGQFFLQNFGGGSFEPPKS